MEKINRSKLLKYVLLIPLAYVSLLGYIRIFNIAAEEVSKGFIVYNISITLVMIAGVAIGGTLLMTFIQHATRRGTGKFKKNLILITKATLSVLMTMGYTAYIEMLPTPTTKVVFFLLPVVVLALLIWFRTREPKQEVS